VGVSVSVGTVVAVAVGAEVSVVVGRGVFVGMGSVGEGASLGACVFSPAQALNARMAVTANNRWILLFIVAPKGCPILPPPGETDRLMSSDRQFSVK